MLNPVLTFYYSLFPSGANDANMPVWKSGNLYHRTFIRGQLILQGSLHYTLEHCFVNGGFPLFWWKKPCFKWATCIFQGAVVLPELAN